MIERNNFKENQPKHHSRELGEVAVTSFDNLMELAKTARTDVDIYGNVVDEKNVFPSAPRTETIPRNYAKLLVDLNGLAAGGSKEDWANPLTDPDDVPTEARRRQAIGVK